MMASTSGRGASQGGKCERLQAEVETLRGLLREAEEGRLSAEKALRDTKTRLEAFLDNSPAVAFLKDDQGRHVYINQPFVRMFQRDSRSLIGATAFDIFPAEVAHQLHAHDALVLETNRPVETIEIVPTPDGVAHSWLVYKFVVQETSGKRFLGGMALDITKHQLDEQTLRRQQALLQNIIQHIPCAVFWKDTNGVYLGCNTRNAQDFGAKSPEELIGLTDLDFHVKPEEAEFYRSCDREVMTTGRPLLDIEETQHRRDGSKAFLLTSKVPLRDGDEVVGVLGIYADVTERKRLEEQVRQSQKMEAIGQLAGGVAHDFNNLLCVINGYGQLLLNDMQADDPSAAPVREIVRAGERAAGLTRQLLAFGRKAIIEPKVLDLKEVVSDLERMLSRIIGEDVEFATRIDPAPALIKADPGHIEQIIMNLVVNARDAMPQGGKLTLAVRAVELDKSYAAAHPEARPGPHVLLAVTDTGKGMDRATMARIWEPFFSTKGEKGCGLGLATVYGAVRQNGGHIDVSSELGRGTTFMVYLPRAPERRRVVPTPLDAAALPRGNERILLVEDEAAVRELARRILQGCGYEVLTAANGPDALLAAQEYSGVLELVVTDVVMPQMGGRETANQLTRMRPGIRVLYMSGYTDDSVVRHGILEHEVAFLSKPFSALALAEKVRAVLDQRWLVS